MALLYLGHLSLFISEILKALINLFISSFRLSENVFSNKFWRSVNEINFFLLAFIMLAKYCFSINIFLDNQLSNKNSSLNSLIDMSLFSLILIKINAARIIGSADKGLLRLVFMTLLDCISLKIDG